MREVLIRCLAVGVFLFAVLFINNWFIDKALSASAPACESEIPLPILMYHSILKDSGKSGAYIITPKVLKSDLEYLKKRGYEAISIKDLIAFVETGEPLPEKPVMITFDDGYYNNYMYAYPILKELDMKGVISIVGKLSEDYEMNKRRNPNWSYLNPEDIKEMHESGIIEIENHSYNLHKMEKRRGCLRVRGEDKNDYKILLQEDTMKNQSLLAELGIPAPICYTYPFGSVNNESESIINSLGFKCTLGCEEGINKITRDKECLFRMKRFNRPAGKSSEAFIGRILDRAEKS